MNYPYKYYHYNALYTLNYVVCNSATPWTVAHQAPLSMGFPRQKYCSGLPFPSPGDLADPGINPHLLHWQADSLPWNHLGSLIMQYISIYIM